MNQVFRVRGLIKIYGASKGSDSDSATFCGKAVIQ